MCGRRPARSAGVPPARRTSACHTASTRKAPRSGLGRFRNSAKISASSTDGGEHADYDIEGIGNDFVAETMDMALVDEVVKVADEEAFDAARDLARREGIVAGSSSGAALAAALRAIRAGLRGNVVVLFPDRGDRYFSKGLFTAD